MALNTKVLFIYRNSKMGYSIEKIYSQIQKELAKKIEVDAIWMPEFGYSLSSLIKNILYTAKYVKNNKYDVIHITGTENYLIPFIKKNNRVVVTVHDLGFYVEKKLNARLKLKKIFFIDTLKHADKIVCISQKTLNEVENVINISHDKFEVVDDPVGSEYVYTEKKINSNNPVILHVGTRDNKNLENAIKALKNFNCHLRIIGELSDEQKRLLKENEINYSYTFNLSDKDILEEYVKADIVSFPSLYEGFGMIICEAQAVGRPVVTSNISPMKEIAGDGAVLVDPYSPESIRNGYVEALNNSEKYIMNGLKNVKRFTLENTVDKLIEIYKNI